MYHCFLDDSALYETQAAWAVLESVADVGVGYLGDDRVNYFYKHMNVRDRRATRLQPSNFTAKPKGKLSLHFDNEFASASELNDVGSQGLTHLFNLIEFIYLAQDLDAAQIESQVDSEEFRFGGILKSNTLQLASSGSDSINPTIILEDDSTKQIRVRDWFQFEVDIAGKDLAFKIWLHGSAFETDYPLTKIIKILPPVKPSWFITNQYENVQEAISDSADFVFNIHRQAEQMEGDFSGLHVFKTRFKSGITESGTDMPFGVLYRGAVPGSISCREHIRSYLENSGWGTLNDWKIKFPGLYVTDQVFVVPMWHNTTLLPSGVVYPGILKVKDIVTKLIDIFPDMDVDFIKDNVDVFTVPGNTLSFASIHDPQDADGDTRLRTFHKTYMPVDGGSSHFLKQETATQEFNMKMSSCVAVLLGGENDNDALFSNVIGGNYYLSFDVGYIEYHVLRKESMI